ncbi:MAG TPA: response regulator transcription factor [Mariprofundaceae bacterium]|nr:response regulator transcription factor [Mariprofundaceae bacterium]
MKTRVLIVDDHKVVRQGLSVLVNSIEGFEVVGEAECGENGYRSYFDCRPDIVLLDLKMPGEGGLGMLRRLLARDPKARVIMLTMYSDVVFPKRVLEMGARGYLTKGVGLEVLKEALYTVMAGKSFVEPELAQQMVASGDQEANNPANILTPREFEVFEMLARGDSVHQIADQLHLSPKTVNVHRGNVLKKLKVANPVHLAHIAFQHGVLIDQ